jgi:excisionase family DNA binding protein
MQTLARMRTIDEAYSELKQLDPNTAVSKYFIRRLALSGKIPTMMCGRKRLLNFDGLLAYLNGTTPSTAEQTPRLVGIYSIKE